MWVLEDHLDAFPKRSHLAVRQFRQVYLFLTENETATCWWYESEQTASGGRLSTAALANETERFTTIHVETDPIYRFDIADGALEDPFLDREVFSEVVYLKQFFHFLIIGFLLRFFPPSQ